MGRLLLFLVMAAALGGSILAVNTRDTLGETSRRAAETQADVLAREIAEAGRSAALGAMLDKDGFRDPTRELGDSQAYSGGQFAIEYTEGATGHEATLQVSGTYGGAVHTIESSYAYDPMDAPGPMWLDVPYATSTISNKAQIKGGDEDKPVQFDRRKHDEYDLEGLAPLGALATSMRASTARAGSDLAIPSADHWAEPGGLLDHLNVDDAEGLYQKAVAAVDLAAGDLRRDGNVTLSTKTQFGFGRSGEGVAFYNGDLTITSELKGEGALIINGALRVPSSGKLDWKGLVIVHGTQDVLPVELNGKVTIDGMVAVAHQAFPPGGHLDVSVYRARAGMVETAPAGDLSEQVSPWRRGYPFHQHTHAFDITPTSAPRGDHVYFLEDGRAGRHETQAQFASLLSRLGTEPVYLEIANADNHGFSGYAVDVAGDGGTGGRMAGTIQGGFRSFARADNPRATRVFPANELKALDIDVRSLRALKRAFDGPECSSWPLCIGNEWDRKESMAVRLIRASDGARLYEATLYWHMRQDEVATHQAEEAAWRARIQRGEAFGTRLVLGDDVKISFDLEPIDALSRKLDFAGDRVTLVASRSFHLTPAESGIDPHAPVETSGSGGSGGASSPVAMCLASRTISVSVGNTDVYLALGARMGECDCGGSGGGCGGD